MAGKYHVQEGMVDSYGATSFKGFDAQAEFHLVRAKASKRRGSDQLESNSGHNHAERQSNIESGMKVI